MPPRREQLLPAARWHSAWPHRAAVRARFDPAPFRRLERVSGELLARPWRASRSSSSSDSAIPARPRTISPSAQNVIALAVRRRPALVPQHGLDERRPGTSPAPRRGGSCRCRPGPTIDTSRGRRSRAVAWSWSLSSRSSASRPTNGGSRPPFAPARRGGRRRQRHATPRTGASFPLSSWVSDLLERDRAPAARWVDSPTSTVPGSAADWSRSGVDHVAGNHALALARARGHGGFAGQDRRRGRGGLRPRRAADRADQLQGRPHRALRVVLVRDRRAPDGHDRVADELLDQAAVAAHDLPARGRSSASAAPGCPRRRAARGRGEADQVDEQDGDEPSLRDRPLAPGLSRRGAGRCGCRCLPAAASVVPHSPQNFAVAGFSVPHAGQAAARDVPHSTQNFRSGIVLRAAVGAGQQGKGASIGSVRLIRRCSIRPIPCPVSPGGDRQASNDERAVWRTAVSPQRRGSRMPGT